MDSPSHYIRSYLSERSETFAELAKVQTMGWGMPSGDEHFKKQRQHADTANSKVAAAFFHKMRYIGDEMHDATGVFTVKQPGRFLDLCMAPGGYSATALKINPQASVAGATLPQSIGGHELRLKRHLEHQGITHVDLTVWCGDLTCLVEDMGIDIKEHMKEDAIFGKFEHHKKWAGRQFDLVFCDGQLIRPHAQTMAEIRRRCEASRLLCSQLLIGLKHVTDGGSMVILLHNLDSWNSVLIVHAFDKFAHITVFKPLSAHKARGSFYLIAKNIQPQHPDALVAIQNWTHTYMDATFGALKFDTPEVEASVGGDVNAISECQVLEVLEGFGDRLIALGEKIWKIQADAIKAASWFKPVQHEDKMLSPQALAAGSDTGV